MLEWFRDATSFQNAMNGLLAAITAVGIPLAWLFGRKKKAGALSAPDPSSITVMGDVVVVKKLDDLVKAMDMNTMALTNKAVALQKNTGALDAYTEGLSEVRRAVERNTEQIRGALERNTDTAREVAEEAERVARAMREHADRMIRLNSGH